MKIIYILLAACLVVTVSSCKKCYNCTFPSCYACIINGSTGNQYCNGNYSVAYLNTLGSQCAQSGGVWTVITNGYSNSYCSSGGLFGNVALTSEEDDCTSSGGTWTQK